MLQPISVLRLMQRARRLLGDAEAESHVKPKSQSGTQQHNGNGRNDYAEFSHGEHPKSQLEKSA